MRQVTINREAKEVTITETRQRVLNLDMTDNKGNWLGSDSNGKFYSNNPKGIEESLWEDVEGAQVLATVIAARYLSRIRKKGIEKV